MIDSKLSDQLYRQCKEDILTFKLEPGESVSIQKLSERYGGSRTPAREAVVRLQQEGLLNVRPQSETVISPISVERIRQERFIRSALETAVVEDFIKNCSQITIDTLEQIIALSERELERKNYEGTLQADIRFHRTIFETAHDVLTPDVSTAQCSHDIHMRYLALSLGNQGNNVIEGHTRIVDAARERDGNRMRTLTQEHLSVWKKLIVKLRPLCPLNYFVD